MKSKSVIRFALTGALVCIGALGAFTVAASADAALTVPASTFPAIPLITDSNGNPIPLPSSGGAEIVGNCPAFLFSDPVGFQFTSGNAVIYRIVSLNPLNINGGNAEGNADLVDLTTGLPSGYQGHTHFWFGQNINPTGNSQFYIGDTLTFQGTGPGNSSITITGSGGGTISASGHGSGWGHLKVTCS